MDIAVEKLKDENITILLSKEENSGIVRYTGEVYVALYQFLFEDQLNNLDLSNVVSDRLCNYMYQYLYGNLEKKLLKLTGTTLNLMDVSELVSYLFDRIKVTDRDQFKELKDVSKDLLQEYTVVNNTESDSSNIKLALETYRESEEQIRKGKGNLSEFLKLTDSLVTILENSIK